MSDKNKSVVPSFREGSLQRDALTPSRVVEYLDRYIVGQEKAKRAVAVAPDTETRMSSTVPLRLPGLSIRCLRSASHCLRAIPFGVWKLPA